MGTGSRGTITLWGAQRSLCSFCWASTAQRVNKQHPVCMGRMWLCDDVDASSPEANRSMCGLQVQDKKPLGAAYQRIAKSLAKEKAQVGQQKSTVTLPRGCQG